MPQFDGAAVGWDVGERWVRAGQAMGVFLRVVVAEGELLGRQDGAREGGGKEEGRREGRREGGKAGGRADLYFNDCLMNRAAAGCDRFDALMSLDDDIDDGFG